MTSYQTPKIRDESRQNYFLPTVIPLRLGLDAVTVTALLGLITDTSIIEKINGEALIEITTLIYSLCNLAQQM